MESKVKGGDPLDMLPDIPLNSIAHTVGNVSPAGIAGSAKRLGITLIRTATGRQAAKPRDAVRIIEELRQRACERNST